MLIRKKCLTQKLANLLSVCVHNEIPDVVLVVANQLKKLTDSSPRLSPLFFGSNPAGLSRVYPSSFLLLRSITLTSPVFRASTETPCRYFSRLCINFADAAAGSSVVS